MHIWYIILFVSVVSTLFGGPKIMTFLPHRYLERSLFYYGVSSVVIDNWGNTHICSDKVILIGKVYSIVTDAVAKIGERYLNLKVVGAFIKSWTDDEIKLHTKKFKMHSTFFTHLWNFKWHCIVRVDSGWWINMGAHKKQILSFHIWFW